MIGKRNSVEDKWYESFGFILWWFEEGYGGLRRLETYIYDIIQYIFLTLFLQMNAVRI